MELSEVLSGKMLIRVKSKQHQNDN